MATISDPAQHDPLSEPDSKAWAAGLDAQVPRRREPREERFEPPPARGGHGSRNGQGRRPDPEQALTAAHYTIVVADVEGFGDYSRTNGNQVRVRRGLYRSMIDAFGVAGILWHECRIEDRGDGVFILVPASVPKALFADRLPGALADALREHNGSHPPEEQIRLRLALSAGEIYQDEYGVTGAAINRTFRILDAVEVKNRFADVPGGVLAMIGSEWFYDEVIRHSDWSRAKTYVAVEVDNKETRTRAWVRIVG